MNTQVTVVAFMAAMSMLAEGRRISVFKASVPSDTPTAEAAVHAVSSLCEDDVMCDGFAIVGETTEEPEYDGLLAALEAGKASKVAEYAAVAAYSLHRSAAMRQSGADREDERLEREESWAGYRPMDSSPDGDDSWFAPTDGADAEADEHRHGIDPLRRWDGERSLPNIPEDRLTTLRAQYRGCASEGWNGQPSWMKVALAHVGKVTKYNTLREGGFKVHFTPLGVDVDNAGSNEARAYMAFGGATRATNFLTILDTLRGIEAKPSVRGLSWLACGLPAMIARARNAFFAHRWLQVKPMPMPLVGAGAAPLYTNGLDDTLAAGPGVELTISKSRWPSQLDENREESPVGQATCLKYEARKVLARFPQVKISAIAARIFDEERGLNSFAPAYNVCRTSPYVTGAPRKGVSRSTSETQGLPNLDPMPRLGVEVKALKKGRKPVSSLRTSAISIVEMAHKAHGAVIIKTACEPFETWEKVMYPKKARK